MSPTLLNSVAAPSRHLAGTLRHQRQLAQLAQLSHRATFSSISRRNPSKPKPALASNATSRSRVSNTRGGREDRSWNPANSTTPPRSGGPAAPRMQRRSNKSPEYKSAARKWSASIVALPVFLVTSYYLFDRLILGNPTKDLPSSKSDLGAHEGGDDP
ncbi:uncharacterized protein DNG_10397 [Cephalotrichum gorgonifer]|uniref:Uncharacterized protein n=1 Tax=Cephalotrichum gorgonifer TaxID=2041049 RepID=A0AAE8N7M9_9PEZI|nr:uncharacterized protein DNG_10397 [Cephalotrichum gorgonifer]